MSDVNGVKARRPWRRAWGRFWRNPMARTALGGFLALVLVVLTAPAWWRHDPNALSDAQWAPPSREHWLGTDANGRDVLARVCAGARVSLWVGFAGAAVSLVIGVIWGATAGYAGGRIDGILMRTVDLLYSMPTVIFIIVVLTSLREAAQDALVALFGRDAGEGAPLALLVIGLGAISWLTMARIVRGQVRSLRERPFVEAARALGASHARILARHVLPNTAGVIIVYMTLTIPAVVLAESFLSYLGLGIQPPQASLGSLIAEGAGQINPIETHWWLLAGPGGALVGLLLTLSFVGDGLRDAFDPRADS
jgi:oligopeptide transport system permease protein